MIACFVFVFAYISVLITSLFSWIVISTFIAGTLLFLTLSLYVYARRIAFSLQGICSLPVRHVDQRRNWVSVHLPRFDFFDVQILKHVFIRIE